MEDYIKLMNSAAIIQVESQDYYLIVVFSTLFLTLETEIAMTTEASDTSKAVMNIKLYSQSVGKKSVTPGAVTLYDSSKAPGIHYLQKDHPNTFGEALAGWIQKLN
jgi:hypothetical protein